MLFLRPSTVLLLLFLITAPSVNARDWFEYRSDNFTIYSDVSQRQVENLLRDLEKFRTAAHIFTELESKPERQRLKIFHFSRSSELKRFTGTLIIAGAYRDTWAGPIIFSSKQNQSITSVAQVMFHEYTHHLMKDRDQMHYPKWYSEGFAELLKTAQIAEDSVIFGGIPRSQLSARCGPGYCISGISIKQLMQPNFESENPVYWGTYYMGAWLLTHYLELGHLLKSNGSRSKMREYLLAVKNGEDPATAFEKYIERSPEELQRELQQYLKGKVANIVVRIPNRDLKIVNRKLPDNERSYLLAESAFHSGREESALDYLLRPKKRDAEFQVNLSLSAVLHAHNDKFGTAAKLVEEVESGVLGDPRTFTNLAHYYVDRLEDSATKNVWNEELYRMAVHYARAAIELNPSYLPAYRYLWSAQQQKGEEEEVVRTMMSAYGRFPSNPFLIDSIAFYLADIGRQAEAIPFLRKIIAWSHPGETRSAAVKILKSLDAENQNTLAEETVTIK